jgi:histidinol-phosphatase (PHP family)
MMSDVLKFNLHTHSRFCDGSGNLEEYVLAALDRNIKVLGFSSHAPVPYENDWAMPEKDFPLYRDTIFMLKEKYKERIDILFSLEVDYIPGIITPKDSKILNYGLDYILGSVHVLGQLEDGKYFAVDGPEDELKKGIDECFKGDTKEAVITYYDLISRMAGSYPPDIIGHLDLVKLYNRDNTLFDENSPWYKETVLKTLKTIAKSACVMEVNTGSMTRKGLDSFYPSEWIIRDCFELNIPLMVNSDAHEPEQVDGFFEKAYEVLKKAGYRKLVYFSSNGNGYYPL